MVVIGDDELVEVIFFVEVNVVGREMEFGGPSCVWSWSDAEAKEIGDE